MSRTKYRVVPSLTVTFPDSLTDNYVWKTIDSIMSNPTSYPTTYATYVVPTKSIDTNVVANDRTLADTHVNGKVNVDTS